MRQGDPPQLALATGRLAGGRGPPVTCADVLDHAGIEGVDAAAVEADLESSYVVDLAHDRPVG